MRQETSTTASSRDAAPRQAGLWLILVAATFAVSAVWTGCGGPSGSKKCKNVTCERGVCNPKTGQCTNPDSCGAPSSGDAGMTDAGGSAGAECLEGYACVDGSCKAKVSCESGSDCRSGSCQNGACVNPDGCQQNDDCVKGHLCNDQNQCIENKCSGDDPCARGVCKPETGQCVNREACPSPEGEAPACLEGYKCHDQTCMDEQALCEALECDRGVCSFEQKKCVDAETCMMDTDCLAGKYCEAGSCKSNECDPDSGQCDRGVCDPKEGCINAETCQAADECLPDHYCVDGACVPTETACGEDGCPGHQVCSYDAENLKAECEENDAVACRNAIDCTGERVCLSGRCADAPACQDDSHEPNDTDSEAVGYQDVANPGDAPGVSGSICSGDTDVFTFDTEAGQRLRGHLSVFLSYAPSDVGVGPLKVVLKDPNGQTVASESTESNGRPGRLHVQTSVDASSTGVYTVVVTDPGGVGQAGVHYDLSMRFPAQNTHQACTMADTLGASQSGDTTNGTSQTLAAGCAEDGVQTPENIFTFTLDKRSYVDIDVKPSGSSTDLVASLRHACLNPASEVSCADATGDGGDETIEQILPAGSYTLLVQGAAAGKGGGYTVEFDHHAVECSAADDHCLGDGAAKVCNDKGKMTRVECDEGCDSTYGRCQRPAGDTCWTAVDVSATGANNELENHTVNWSNLANRFDGPSDSCADGSASQVDGPDSVFRVTVPAGGALWAQLEPTSSDSEGGSLYVLGGCKSGQQTCRAVADDTKPGEMLTYKNTGMRPEGVYLVADSASGTTGTSVLNVQAGPMTCSEGDTSCESGAVETCNAARVGFRHAYDCPAGCTSGACDGDTCMATIDAGTGGTWTVDPTKFADDYTLRPNDCAGELLDGPDAVFAVDVQADQVVEAQVTAQNHQGDPTLYLTDTCATGRPHAAGCKAGADLFDDDTRETLVHQVGSNGAGTYYVVLDSESTPPDGAKWELEIQTHSPVCDPGSTQCSGQTGLSFCTRNGTGSTFYGCQGSNKQCVTRNGTKACKNPAGGDCADPIPVSDGDTMTGDFTGDNDLAPNAGHIGRCYFAPSISMIGKETYYVADLDKGDLLHAKLRTKSAYGRVYLLEDCQTATSCLENSRGDRELTYHADSDQKVYLVVDAHSQFRKTLKYNLDVSITPGKHCKPGATRCIGPKKAAICNQSGTGNFDTVTCPKGCANGVCRDDPTKYDKCSNVPNIGDGIALWGDFGELQPDVTLPPNNCVGSKTEGPDAWYAIDVTKGELLTAEVNSRGDDKTVLYLATNCSKPAQSCVAGDFATSAGETLRLQHRAKKTRTLYVGVDKRFNNTAEPFWVEIGTTTNQCSPGATRCASNGTDLEYCSSKGIWKTYSCATTCQQRRCTQPGGDACFDPIPLSDGDVVSGDFSGTNTSSVKDVQFGGCFLERGDKTEGADTFYTMNLQTGDLLRAEFETSSPNAQLMITENCARSSACRTNNASGGSTVHYYRADSPQQVQLVVDSTSSSTSARYTLSVDVLKGRTCAPGQTQCSGASKVGICNGGGTGWLGQYLCANGCEDGRCKTHSGIDSCKNAPTITGGTVVTPNLGNLKDKVAITDTASCVSHSGTGSDAVYKINAAQGATYDIRARSPGGQNTMVYVLQGCQDPDNTCVAGNSAREGKTAHTIAQAKKQGPLYVVVDSWNSRADEPVELQVRKLSPQCSGSSRMCRGQNILGYCSPRRQSKAHICNESCQNGACRWPTADTCLEGIPMGDGDRYTGRISNFSADLNTGPRGCDIFRDDQAPVGPDAVFTVDLKAGETLDAQLDTGEKDLGMYILDSCPTKDAGTSCLRGVSDGDRLRYNASQPGTYYLVVDAEYTSEDDVFTLETTIETGDSCTPGATSCQSGKLAVCAEDGSGVAKTYTCPNGCTDGRCKTPNSANDTCGRATPITGGIRIVDRFSRFTDNYDPSSASKACVSNAGGPDAVYSVQLQAGETVTADLDIKDDNDEAAVYILDQCAGKSTSCAAGQQSARESTASTGYYNGTGSTQTVYVVADNDGSRVDGGFELNIDVHTADCDPTAASPNTCKNSDTAKVCTEIGHYVERTCHFGCDNATGSCKAAPNDQCGGAVKITSAGTYRSNMRHYQNDYENAFGFSLRGCTGGTTRGPDAVYQVTLKKGEIIDLTYDAPSEAALWITTDCKSPGRNCKKGVNASDPEHMTFMAPADDTYYILADTDTNAASVGGEMVLDVNHVGPPGCMVGMTSCKPDGKTLSRCEAPGIERTYTCQGGCSNGSCGQPTGGICADAVPVSDGATVTGRFDSSNAVDPTTSLKASCSFGDSSNRPVGGDRIYAVDLQAGETVTAEYVSSARAAVLYAMTTCGDPTTCTGTTQRGPTGTLQYTAPSQQTVYLVMDRSVPGRAASSEFQLSVSVD